MNQVRWLKEHNKTPLVQVKEGVEINWKPYTQSRLYVADRKGFSKGYLTYLACFKAGYKVN